MDLTIRLDIEKGDHTSAETIKFLGDLLTLLSSTESPQTDENYNPDERIYGQKGKKSRRTKDEVTQDEDIAARWSELWPSKDVPEKPVGDILATIQRAELRMEGSQEDTPEGPQEDAALLDLEEFRAVIVKHSKALGGKRLSEIMAPHKNPAEVPEGQRRVYADKIMEAAADAE